MEKDSNSEDLFSGLTACSLEPSSIQANNHLLRRNDTAKGTGPSRNTTLRRKKPNGPDPFGEFGIEKEADLKSGLNSIIQSFWKFHVLKFGSGLYLTTNPTLRHLHCRNAPGYFVQISGTTVNYSMSFEDIESGEQLVEVHKVSDRSSNYFDFAVRSTRVLREGQVRDKEDNPLSRCREDHVKDPNLSELGHSRPNTASRDQTEEAWSDAFLGRLVRTPIPEILLPVAPTVPMLSYESKMMDRLIWSVGSIPRYRESRINSSETKYVAKRNVYFHRSFTNLETHTGRDMPSVLAVYRECESRSKKRVIRQINRLSRVGSLLSSKDNSTSSPSVDPYSETSSYQKCGDGLYSDKLPSDDEPDHHHKLGWVTIYEDEDALSQQGMFDLVVALSVAIGYDNHINLGPAE